MSGKGNCSDNAMVETFFKTLKSELVWRTTFFTRADAERYIARYIDGFYNPFVVIPRPTTSAPHSSKNWRSVEPTPLHFSGARPVGCRFVSTQDQRGMRLYLARTSIAALLLWFWSPVLVSKLLPADRHSPRSHQSAPPPADATAPPDRRHNPVPNVHRQCSCHPCRLPRPACTLNQKTPAMRIAQRFSMDRNRSSRLQIGTSWRGCQHRCHPFSFFDHDGLRHR